MQVLCQECRAGIDAARLGEPLACPGCSAIVGKLSQLEQALARWYEPRRWRADLVEPNIYYLIERLWTADGQGEALYQAVSPKHINYDIFRYMMTRLIARGIEAGWADIVFPEDPLVEDPVYYLEFTDGERFSSEVEALFPDVDWDEEIQAPSGVPEQSG